MEREIDKKSTDEFALKLIELFGLSTEHICSIDFHIDAISIPVIRCEYEIWKSDPTEIERIKKKYRITAEEIEENEEE